MELERTKSPCELLKLSVLFSFFVDDAQNLGVDFGSGQIPSSSTPFLDHMDAANQQTLQLQQSATHALASSDTNNHQQATLRGILLY